MHLKSAITPLRLAVLLQSVFTGQSQCDTAFDWNALQPASDLVYHECYGRFHCARLEVPLDWTNTSNLNTVALAVIKLSAKTDATDPSFGGTIITDPGGPGGSGVDLIRHSGQDIQEIVDSNKNFEILSFDHRGVHFTTPRAACFDDHLSRQTWQVSNAAVGLVDASSQSLNYKWRSTQGLAELCSKTNIGVYPDGSNIRQYVSTGLGARDLLGIIDAVEKERERVEDRNTQQVIEDEGHRKPALLNYWGFSYGSYLGNTFASMFPHRIGRMVLDGVVDAPDYTATGWTTNRQDVNPTLRIFFRDCFESGTHCRLYNETDSDPSDIVQKVNGLLASLIDNPIRVIHDGTTELLTYAEVTYQIFQSLYSPLYSWPQLSRILADLIAGNTSSAIPWITRIDASIQTEWSTRRSSLTAFNVPGSEPYPPAYPHMAEASKAILCGDGNDISNTSKAQYAQYVELLQGQASLAAGYWAEIILPCIHWQHSIRPAAGNRFTGPFQSHLRDYDVRASPLLFVGNKADPATPLRNAFKMAEAHEGSVVLTQDTPGHCSGPVNPNDCTFRVLEGFFADGALPEAGKICPRDRKPWRL